MCDILRFCLEIWNYYCIFVSGIRSGICEDYTWIHSKEGEKILQIEQWIKKTRCNLASDYPNAMIYIGRSFINPISLIIGGFVENQNTEELFKKYFNNLRPPINIDYKISLFS